MALNSFLIRLINLSFLHGILFMRLSIAPHTKKSIGFRSSEFRAQMSGETKSMNEVVAQRKLRFSPCIAGHKVLLPHIWSSSSHLTYPEQYVHLQNLHVLHHVDLQALLEDVWRYDVTFIQNHSKHHHSGWKLGLHDF